MPPTLTRTARHSVVAVAVVMTGAAFAMLTSDRLVEASIGRAVLDRTAHGGPEAVASRRPATGRQLVGDEHFWLATQGQVRHVTPAVARDYGVAIGNHIEIGRPGRAPIVLEIVSITDAPDKHQSVDQVVERSAAVADVIVTGRVTGTSGAVPASDGMMRLVLDPALLRSLVVESSVAGRSL